MYVKRDLEDKILKYLDKKEIIAIIGPRQSGKTTLMRHIYDKLENAVFLDFEDRETLELFVEDEKSFAELYAKNKKYLFIDEFHYAKKGGKKLKYIYDHYPNLKIFISGSSAPAPTIHGIKHLVGRIFIFNLHPFSFPEFLRYKDESLYDLYISKAKELKKYFKEGQKAEIPSALIKKLNNYYESYILFGGYPRVILSDDADEKKVVLKNIYNTYFLREVKDILNLTTDFKLSKLIKALAIQIGNLISYNSLGNVSGFRYKELLRHLNILEKTFICKRINPFYTNKKLEIVKSPKVYFFDTGLRNMVIDDFRKLDKRDDIGKLNENFVFSQMLINGFEPKFWRSKSKAEVDFVLEKEGLTALEVKTGFSSRTTKSFSTFIKKYNPNKAIIASQKNFKLGKTDFLPLSFLAAPKIFK